MKLTIPKELFLDKKNWPKLLLLIALLILLMTIFLSWKPSPDMSQWGLLPDSIAKWADKHQNDQIRTGVPFALMSFLIGIYLYSESLTGLKQWIAVVLILFIFVLFIELIQYFIPERRLDIKDVFWGFCGCLFGIFFPFIVWKIKQIK